MKICEILTIFGNFWSFLTLKILFYFFDFWLNFGRKISNRHSFESLKSEFYNDISVLKIDIFLSENFKKKIKIFKKNWNFLKFLKNLFFRQDGHSEWKIDFGFFIRFIDPKWGGVYHTTFFHRGLVFDVSRQKIWNLAWFFEKVKKRSKNDGIFNIAQQRENIFF